MISPLLIKSEKNENKLKGRPLDKDWVTWHSGTIGHSVARHSVAWALKVLGTQGTRHSRY